MKKISFLHLGENELLLLLFTGVLFVLHGRAWWRPKMPNTETNKSSAFIVFPIMSSTVHLHISKTTYTHRKGQSIRSEGPFVISLEDWSHSAWFKLWCRCSISVLCNTRQRWWHVHRLFLQKWNDYWHFWHWGPDYISRLFVFARARAW